MREFLEKLERKGDAMQIVKEASYPGNLGYSEMMKFYKVATEDEISEMEDLLKRGDFKGVWRLLQRVTGTKLGKQSARWNPRAAYA